MEWLWTVTGDRVLVATDESANGRHAIRTARALIGANSAPLTILKVVPVAPDGHETAGRLLTTGTRQADVGSSPALDQFRAWLAADPEARPVAPEPEVAVAFGVPGIEISRLADEREAGLIVLGREDRSPSHRLSLGETADAVVRRSDRPVLFVPPELGRIRRVLVALDGTERAAQVLEQANSLARRFGAALEAVTVEPDLEDERAIGRQATLPRGRSVRLGDAIRRLSTTDPGNVRLAIRRGNPIEEVLAQCGESQPDVLVIGYRRGGPPKVFGPADIARSLLYAAPCAVLTVPL